MERCRRGEFETPLLLRFGHVRATESAAPQGPMTVIRAYRPVRVSRETGVQRVKVCPSFTSSVCCAARSRLLKGAALCVPSDKSLNEGTRFGVSVFYHLPVSAA